MLLINNEMRKTMNNLNKAFEGTETKDQATRDNLLRNEMEKIEQDFAFKEQIRSYDAGYADAEAEITDINRMRSDAAYREGVQEWEEPTQSVPNHHYEES
jgi:Tfp pilus assembly protein PilN